jgi:hypothetical protein
MSGIEYCKPYGPCPCNNARAGYWDLIFRKVKRLMKRALLITLILTWIALATAAPAESQIAVTAANPNTTTQGTVNLNVTISGKGFKRGAAASFFLSGSNEFAGVIVNSTAFVSSSQVVANITVYDEAKVANFDIQVENADGRTGKGIELFSITAKGSKQGPPPDPAIAYSNGGDIMVMNADGTNQRLVFGDGDNYVPDWSPDGKRLVFAHSYSVRVKGTSYLYTDIGIVGLDGIGYCTLVSRVAHRYYAAPVWSPPLADGHEWIAYVGNDETGRWKTYAVRADCTNPGRPIKLTPDDVDEWWPAWSRTGGRFAVSRAAGGYGHIAAYDVVLVNGTPQLQSRFELRQNGLGPQNEVESFAASWARTSDRLVFTARNATGTGLWISDLTPLGTYQITFYGTGTVGDFYPTFSPDDQEIVTEYRPPEGPSVWKMGRTVNADGSESWPRTQQFLSGSLNGYYPRWRHCDVCP